MNIFVNIFKILIILVVIAAGLVLVAFGALVIFPGFSLFGLHYIKGDAQVVGQYYDIVDNMIEYQSVDTILLKTNQFDIETYPVDAGNKQLKTDCISVHYSHNYNGFVFGDVKEPVLKEPRIENVAGDNRLVFEVLEPQGGLLSKIDTKLKVFYLPSMVKNKNLMIETNTGLVEVGNDKELEVNKLTINSAKGKVLINKIAPQDDVNINKLSGDITSKSSFDSNVTIEVTDGFSKISLQNVGNEYSPTALVLGSKKAMANPNIELGDVYGDLSIWANGGLLRGRNVTKSFIADVDSCDIYLDTISKNVTYKSQDGSLYLKKTMDKVTAQSFGKGEIFIDENNNSVNVTTEKGQIKLGKTNADVTASTKYGKISIVGGDNKVNYAVKNKNGDTAFDKIKGSIKFEIVEKGKGNVVAKYLNANTDGNDGLFGDNSFTTQSGTIDIWVNSRDTFFYKAWSTKNDVNIQLSGVSSTEKENLTGSFVNGGADGTNNLTTKSVVGKINANHF